LLANATYKFQFQIVQLHKDKMYTTSTIFWLIFLTMMVVATTKPKGKILFLKIQFWFDFSPPIIYKFCSSAIIRNIFI
jgi:hypothetical protein